MFRFSKKGSIEYLEAAALSTHNFLIHAFCTRRGGISEGNFFSLNFSSREGDSTENIRQNWQILATAFDIGIDQFFVVNQIHGDRILIIDRPLCSIIPQNPLQFDAMITDQPGIAIGIKTADCVPIFLVDTVKRIVGVVHAGWRGTALNIAAKAVDTFVERFTSQIADITAVIGPAIGPCCYQVDEIVFDAIKSHKDQDSLFCPCHKQGHWMLDLPLANKFQIIGRGIPEANIYTMACCTSCNRDLFYSHRADGGNTGRQLNFIMLSF